MHIPGFSAEEGGDLFFSKMIEYEIEGEYLNEYLFYWREEWCVYVMMQRRCMCVFSLDTREERYVCIRIDLYMIQRRCI